MRPTKETVVIDYKQEHAAEFKKSKQRIDDLHKEIKFLEENKRNLEAVFNKEYKNRIVKFEKTEEEIRLSKLSQQQREGDLEARERQSDNEMERLSQMRKALKTEKERLEAKTQNDAEALSVEDRRNNLARQANEAEAQRLSKLSEDLMTERDDLKKKLQEIGDSLKQVSKAKDDNEKLKKELESAVAATKRLEAQCRIDIRNNEDQKAELEIKHVESNKKIAELTKKLDAFTIEKKEFDLERDRVTTLLIELNHRKRAVEEKEKQHNNWLRLRNSKYEELTEKEKESDRVWARKTIKLIKADRKRMREELIRTIIRQINIGTIYGDSRYGNIIKTEPIKESIMALIREVMGDGE